jgi:hypothetical protein
MSKYLYTVAANIKDVAPRQQKPPQNPPCQHKTTSKTTDRVNHIVLIVYRCPIPSFMAGV